MSSTQGLTPPEWNRPDWAGLLKAQCEANALRAPDKLPDGITVRAKFADAVYLEVTDGADVTTWPSIHATQPGKWKIGPEFAAPEFDGCATPDAWRAPC